MRTNIRNAILTSQKLQGLVVLPLKIKHASYKHHTSRNIILAAHCLEQREIINSNTDEITPTELNHIFMEQNMMTDDLH